MTERVVTEVLGYLTTNPDPNQIFIFLFGGNNLRAAKRGEREIGLVISRFQIILDEIKKINARVIICGLIPDPLYENLDYRFMDMDHSLSTLDLGPLGAFLELRTPILNSQGFIRGDCYQPYKIHLSKTGAKIIGLKINKYLKTLVRPVQVQVQVQVPTPPAAVSIPHPREAELASLWALVRGYPIPAPQQLQSIQPTLPLSPVPSSSQLSAELAPNEMETDAPVEVESIDTPAPDYPETDEDEMETNEPNTKAAATVSNNDIPDPVPDPVVQPTGSNVNSVLNNPIEPALRPQRPAFHAGLPSTSSDTVQAAPVDQVEFVPTRASTPTPNLDMLDQTSGSMASHVTLDASKLLADNDQSMVGANETIVEKMQKTDLKPKLDVIMEEPEPGTSGSQIE
jgi:hypothetical protein